MIRANPGGLGVRRRSVSVTAVDSTAGTVTVTYADGVASTAGVPCLASYRPAVGDVALLDLVAGSPLAIGRAGGPDVDLIEFKPAGNTDTAASATYATWIALGNITVPTWATRGRYQVAVSAVPAVTAVTTCFFRLTVGGASPVNDRIAVQDPAIGTRLDYTWAGRITGLTAGAQAVAVQYKRTAGTGAFRVDASSLITATFGWET